MNQHSLRNQWFTQPRQDILAGLTVALALIPEAIAFSIIAGVDPMVGLYASFCIAVVIAFIGGRPGMISAATGAMALLMVTLVKVHGLEYLLAATILTGVLQILMGLLRLDRFMSFIPHSVVLGFVNALAILIFMAQLPHFAGESWLMYGVVGGTLAIIYLFPRLTRAFPSALAAIVVMTTVSMAMGLDLKTVGDMGEITRSLPAFHLPQLPLTWETLTIIFPYSLALAIVGILESLMTATIVDDMTETTSDKNREMKGQGIANIVAGMFGGMAGCAMIGQSVINVKSGGRTRLSTLVSGVALLFLILVLGDVVKQIPMAALVGVMIMVSIGTFDWQSLRELHRIPRGDALIMVLTVGIVVVTHNLAQGVLAGVVAAALRYGWKTARIRVTREDEEGVTRYRINGPLFFGSTTHFSEAFQPWKDAEFVHIDMSGSHIWDQSGLEAVSRLLEKYHSAEKQVMILGLNEESTQLCKRNGLPLPVKQ
ncbi:SulP family inorganic anion transporter [Salinithrix halophila]|uniref:SulP family inorganic anion transporter n=1 Tax=Salinithrix halophila TaxID=1485204 RepID=UPI0036D4097A